jgi:hypothetical protein
VRKAYKDETTPFLSAASQDSGSETQLHEERGTFLTPPCGQETIMADDNDTVTASRHSTLSSEEAA